VGTDSQSEGRRCVAVVGTQSPQRSLTLESMLRSCIEEHGWGQRLSVVGAGLGPGAGDAGGRTCTDLEENPELLESADLILVGDPEQADYLLEWPQAEGKNIMAIGEGGGGESDHEILHDPRSSDEEFVEAARRAMADVVRRVISA